MTLKIPQGRPWSENEAALRILSGQPRYAWDIKECDWFIEGSHLSDLQFQAVIQEQLNCFMVDYSYSFVRGVIGLLKPMCLAIIKNGIEIEWLEDFVDNPDLQFASGGFFEGRICEI
jgi:hypothetical protein